MTDAGSGRVHEFGNGRGAVARRETRDCAVDGGHRGLAAALRHECADCREATEAGWKPVAAAAVTAARHRLDAAIADERQAATDDTVRYSAQQATDDALSRCRAGTVSPAWVGDLHG